MVCGSVESGSDAVNVLTVLENAAALMLVNPGPEREQVFPAPMSFVSKKEAAPALPGGPSLLPAQQSRLTRCPSQPAERRLFRDKLGRASSHTGWGKLRGKKPYFILLIQFPAGRSG